MQVNSLMNCRKPRNFGGNAIDNKPVGKKLRYKHYEEMDNEILSRLCLARACNTVQSSGKMKLYNSLSVITPLVIGASLAIAQPGKLAAKAARGLGFLALLSGFDFLSDKVASVIDKVATKKTNSNEKDSKGAALLGMGAGALLFGSAVVAMCAAPKLANKFLSGSNNVSKFVLSEKDKLVDELNSSKLGQFVENKVNPFMEKHGKLSSVFSLLAPVGVILADSAAKKSMKSSLSEDIRKTATNNFVKAKLIQREAKEHFDKIEAEEV